MSGRSAVLFRTHFWDDFAERQYRRLQARVGTGDIFILANETAGPLSIPHSNTISHSEDSVAALGLSRFPYQTFLWYNSDYPLYHFYERFPDYDYYIMSEYDVVVQRNLDWVVDVMAREGIDFVGLTITEALSLWPYTQSALGPYDESQILKQLLCISMYSNRAVRHLFARRRELSLLQDADPSRPWAYCEAFVPTELALAGLKLEELSRFGPAHYYDWRPALLESDLATLTDEGFLHPVLDPARFVQHRTRHLSGAWGLRKLPVNLYARPLTRAILRRIAAELRQRVLGATDERT